MVDSIQVPLLMVAAVLILVLGWLALLVNGRRPVRLAFKGLGLDIAVTPVTANCQEEVTDGASS